MTPHHIRLNSQPIRGTRVHHQPATVKRQPLDLALSNMRLVFFDLKQKPHTWCKASRWVGLIGTGTHPANINFITFVFQNILCPHSSFLTFFILSFPSFWFFRFSFLLFFIFFFSFFFPFHGDLFYLYFFLIMFSFLSRDFFFWFFIRCFFLNCNMHVQKYYLTNT